MGVYLVVAISASILKQKAMLGGCDIVPLEPTWQVMTHLANL